MAKTLPIALLAVVLWAGCLQPVAEVFVGANNATSGATTAAKTTGTAAASTTGGAGVTSSTGRPSTATGASSTGAGTSSNGGAQGTTSAQQSGSGTTGGFGTSSGGSGGTTTGGATTGGLPADICEQAQSVFQELANCPLPQQPSFSFSQCEASLSSCSAADQQAVQGFVTCASTALAGGCSAAELLTLVASLEICQQIISGLSPGCGGGF